MLPQSVPIAMIRALVAAMSIGQNPETTRWTGAATQEVPLDERQTVVILLLPLRTKTTNPCGPAASVAHRMACGPLAARVQVAPSVEPPQRAPHRHEPAAVRGDGAEPAHRRRHEMLGPRGTAVRRGPGCGLSRGNVRARLDDAGRPTGNPTKRDSVIGSTVPSPAS